MQPGDSSQLPARVQAIIDAAEQAAAQLRAETEQRARDRIAEADRAAQHRVDAAEAEAKELLAEAREQARQLVGEARVTAREAMDTGERVSRELEEMGGSLRRNAQTILRDVQKVHRELVAKLDAADPGGRAPARRPAAAAREVSRPGGIVDAEALDLPIRARRTASSDDTPPLDAGDLPGDIEIPEFSSDYTPQRHRRRR